MLGAFFAWFEGRPGWGRRVASRHGAGEFLRQRFSVGHAQPRALPVAPLRSHVPNWKLGALANQRSGRASLSHGKSLRNPQPHASSQDILVRYGFTSTGK